MTKYICKIVRVLVSFSNDFTSLWRTMGVIQNNSDICLQKNNITNVALSFGQSIRNIDFTEKHIDLALRARSICFSVKSIFLMDRPHGRAIFV